MSTFLSEIHPTIRVDRVMLCVLNWSRWYSEDCERVPILANLKSLGDRLLAAIVSDPHADVVFTAIPIGLDKNWGH